ncbi:chromosome segregation protein SMC [Actinomyces sp. 2119]|uniref:AAA family ATPase n=1 Tax=Actinomyces sp. 2119 TaxID=2321393 RepID=UPI000E6D0EAC|nr:AAA family ATPase [Actinomyces sp. 2119]RJF42635.1 chromosome segregation protein SMC [Actinomyces sp. 2119]
MRITQVSASNWRNFKSLDLQLDRRLFVVGPNAAGKSNLLDLFRFLGDIARPGGGLASAVGGRGGLSRVRSLFARNYHRGRLIVDVHLEEGGTTWHYRLSVKGQSGGLNRPVVDEELVERDGTPLLQRPTSEDLDDPERLTQTHLEQIGANQDFRSIAEYVSKVQYFHLVPQVIRDPSRSGLDRDDPFGGDFIAQMNATPPRTRDAWMRRMQAALQAAVPEFESLAIEVDSAGRPHLRAGYRNWRSTPSTQYETEFSDGTLRLIGLLWTVIKAPSGAGTLLLEEPELSLNSAIVRLLPSVLAAAQRSSDLQVVLSTHAPEILDDEGVLPEEVLVLRVTDDGTRADLLSSLPEAVDDISLGLPLSDVVSGLTEPQDLDSLLKAARGRRS